MKSRFLIKILYISTILAMVFSISAPAPSRAAPPMPGSRPSAMGDYRLYLPMLTNSLSPIIPDTTKVLPATTTDDLTSVSADGAVFTFDQTTPDLSALTPGDVMVGQPADAAPDGFLRKINSVNVVNGQTVVQTEAATLEDAVQQGEAQGSHTLTPDQIQSAWYAPGVTPIAGPMGAQALTFHVEIDGVLYDDDKNPETTNDQVTATGSIDVEPTMNFDLRIRDWQVQRFLATASLHDTVDLTVQSKTTLKKFEPEPFTIAKYTLTPFTFWIGWFPVVVTPVLTFEVGIEGELYVAVSASVTQEATLTGGVKYENNQWSPVSEFNNSFDFQPPTISGNLEIKAYAGPRLKFLLYGVAGPELKLDGYLELEVTASLPPAENPFEGKLYGGVGLSVNAKVEVLGKKFVDHEFPDILGWKILIIQWPPAPPADPSPTDGSSNQPTNVNLSWAASDSANTDLFQNSLTYDVYFGAEDSTPDVLVSDNQSGTTFDPLGLLIPGTQYYWQIEARGLFGMTTAGPVWSFTTGHNVWSGSGPGTTTVVSDGTSSNPVFTYSLNLAGYAPVTWNFTTVADHTGLISLGYDFSGRHAWFQVTAFLRATVNGSPVATLVNAGPVDCCTPPSDTFDYTGSYTFNVNAGDTYGFQFGGSNSDSNNFLQGRLEVLPGP